MSLPMTRMTLSANRGLEQRTPASSVQIEEGLGYHRVRTNARTPALLPLLAVLIAALPLPAHADFLVQVCLRDQRCVEIRSENEVPGMIAPICHIA